MRGRRGGETDAEDEFDEEGVSDAGVIRVGRDTGEELRAEFEQAVEFGTGGKSLRSRKVATGFVSALTGFEVASDETL